MHQEMESEVHYFKTANPSYLYHKCSQIPKKKYSNIERELLAVVVVIEKLHHYIFGHHFSVHTDNSPLVNLFEKCLSNTSPDLQCLLLHLNQYQMSVQYMTHKCVPIADCMLQLIDFKTGKEDPSLNLQIADITRANINWNQIKLACLDDPTMIELARTIQKGWPKTGKKLSEDIKPYFPYRYILHIVDGVIFLQDRIVIPKGLRQTFLQKIYDAHLGIVKSRLLGRTLMYWPNWNNDVETTCETSDLWRENQSMPTDFRSKLIFLEKSMVLMSWVYRESLILFWLTITHAVYLNDN